MSLALSPSTWRSIDPAIRLPWSLGSAQQLAGMMERCGSSVTGGARGHACRATAVACGSAHLQDLERVLEVPDVEDGQLELDVACARKRAVPRQSPIRVHHSCCLAR